MSLRGAQPRIWHIAGAREVTTVTRMFISSPNVCVPPLNYRLVPVEKSPALVRLIPPLQKLVPSGHFCQSFRASGQRQESVQK